MIARVLQKGALLLMAFYTFKSLIEERDRETKSTDKNNVIATKEMFYIFFILIFFGVQI